MLGSLILSYDLSIVDGGLGLLGMDVLRLLMPFLLLRMVHHALVLGLEMIILLQITGFVGIFDRLQLALVFLSLIRLVEIHMEVLLVILFKVPFVA